MKKLALALVCVASLAFFASCQKQGQPTITILEGEEYVIDGQTVDLGSDYFFGFTMASNAETGKALASLKVTIDSVEWANVDLTGMTEYTYTDTVNYGYERDSIIGISHITAVVTDVAGETNYATITLNINEPAQPLMPTIITWVRQGTQVLNETEMAGYGLRWTGSYKDVMATLRPLNDQVKLYLCPGDDFETIVTSTDKVRYFANLAENGGDLLIEQYRNITTNNSADYNDLLAVVKDDNTYLIHITRAEIERMPDGSTKITIKGSAK